MSPISIKKDEKCLRKASGGGPSGEAAAIDGKRFAKSARMLYNRNAIEKNIEDGDMFEEILKAIADNDPIIIHRHWNPDGDALGSQIGLKHLILENFPGKTVYTVGDAAGRYGFMEGSSMDMVPDEAFDNALCVILDTAARGLISDERYERARSTARMDHHLFVEKIAQVEVIDSTFESCCGLVTQMAVECGLRINAQAALALYTGMVTDSGRFRYDSTSARTFTLAARLLEQGIDTNELYRNLYANDLEQVKQRARFIQKIQLTPHQVAYIYTSRAEMSGPDADSNAISRGMVGVMSDIRGVDVWVNFTESDKGVLCELRSSRYNINPIAVKYGGGGHMKASGATVKNREEAMRMLEDLDALAEENS